MHSCFKPLSQCRLTAESDDESTQFCHLVLSNVLHVQVRCCFFFFFNDILWTQKCDLYKVFNASLIQWKQHHFMLASLKCGVWNCFDILLAFLSVYLWLQKQKCHLNNLTYRSDVIKQQLDSCLRSPQNISHLGHT